MSWPKTAIPRSCLPACSLKALLTHLHISCTTPSSSLGWAFNRVELVVRSGARSSVISTLLAGGSIHRDLMTKAW
jgi:hypothetical protein